MLREGADRVVLGAGDDDRLAVDGGGEVVADVRDAAGPPDALPLVGEHGLALERQELVGRVDLRRHRERLGHVGDARVERGEQFVGQDGHTDTLLGDTVSACGSRSRNLRILPTLVRGNSSTKVISRGRLAFVSRSAHHACSSSTVGGVRRVGGDHERHRHLVADGVGLADHGGLEHAGVRRQHLLDLDRRHVLAGHLQHVGTAAVEGEPPGGVASGAITGEEPAVAERRTRWWPGRRGSRRTT